MNIRTTDYMTLSQTHCFSEENMWIDGKTWWSLLVVINYGALFFNPNSNLVFGGVKEEATAICNVAKDYQSCHVRYMLSYCFAESMVLHHKNIYQQPFTVCSYSFITNNLQDLWWILRCMYNLKGRDRKNWFPLQGRLPMYLWLGCSVTNTQSAVYGKQQGFMCQEQSHLAVYPRCLCIS